MNSHKEEKLKVGLALGSGGVKGLAHIGVIKVLKENNIPIDFIAGSSIGALIGAFYAAHEDVIKLQKVATQNNWRTSFSFLDPAWKGGIIKGKKVESLIETWLDGVSFNNLKIPLTIVSTDLITGQEVHFNQGDIVKAVRASLSVPIVFKPFKYENYLLLDGGLSNPLPDNIVREMGADVVVSVNLDSDYFSDDLNEKNMSLQKVYRRSLSIMRYHLAENCLKSTDVVIEPKVSEIGLVGWDQFFDKKKADAIIKVGEKAALKALPEIKKYFKK